ncbi:BREX system ATP-binding protein BrxD [Methanofollis aquaemaris]|uniref:BREX system ATP-binding protein BrxD n=1 Tax=Methanofollis aquaemaris TaxID=126734 RepID=A0A8A3S4P3_9EURY|nr:BREX system ATP-binding protein BrxD [Methanofollis aquaemaris]QSZ66606.1 BREX system ATP-binding protein BrxD [Methanofollis aquaemaris]
MNEKKTESIGIINALRRGTVPAAGLERLAVGLEVEGRVIGGQLDYIASGGADIKFVRGDYGSGKTFLVARALEIAREKGFATAHVMISADTPLHKLSALYYRILSSMRTAEHENALKEIIDNWTFSIEERIIDVEKTEEDEALEAGTVARIEEALTDISTVNPALAAALRVYYTANNAGDFHLAQAALGWLSGEPHIGRDFRRAAGVKGEVDEVSALVFLQGIVRVIRGAGYRGLAVAVDEVETVQALSSNLRQRGYNNLRQIVDAADRGQMPGCYFLFTGTPAFFEGSKGIRSLPPLYDRLKVVGDDGYTNPLQAQIELSPFDRQKLEAAAQKVCEIYSDASGPVDRERVSHRFVRGMIDGVTSRFGGRVDVIPRVFLREFVDVLDKCELYPDYDPTKAYAFDAGKVKQELNEEEEAFFEVEF